MPLTLPHLGFVLLIDLIWGFNLIASKVGVTAVPPILFAAMRFMILFVVLVPFLRVYPGQMRAVLVVALTLGVLHFGLIFAGLALTDNVSAVAIAVQLAVPFSVLFSMRLLDEHVGWRRWSGIALAFAGVALIGFDPVVFTYATGLSLVILAALVFGAGVPLSKRLRGVGVLQLQGWIATLSWPVLLALSFMIEGGQWESVKTAGPVIWAALLYTALGASLIGHGGIYYLVQRYDIGLIVPFTLLAPVLSVVFGVTLLDDQLTLRMIIGGIITLVGVFVIARRPAKAPSTMPIAE